MKAGPPGGHGGRAASGTDEAGEKAEQPRLSRRRLVGFGLGGLAGLAVAGAGGVELVAHGVLPGKGLLDRINGACDVTGPPLAYGPVGPAFSGGFYSRARRCRVGYTLAYPPGHQPGSELPLIVALHGFGGDHRNVVPGIGLAQMLALRVNGRPLPPMALIAADGGGGYWNPHPGDDPMAMVIDELIPMCRQRGLGRAPAAIGTLGVSMGGYGAILLAEKHPELFRAVAAIGPAIWTSYAQAQAANPGAYASAAAFRWADAVTHTSALKGIPVRVASGLSDPFHPGVQALATALPAGSVVDISQGCHDGPFFRSQTPQSMAFLGRYLAAG